MPTSVVDAPLRAVEIESPEIQKAALFVQKIKDRFKDEEHVYKSFLRVLGTYVEKNNTLNHVFKEVRVLFQDHPDLMEEFIGFMPPVTMGSQHVSSGKVFVPKGKRSSVKPLMRYSDMVKRTKRRRVESEKEDCKEEDQDREVHERDENGIEHDGKYSDNRQRRKKKTSQRVDESINGQLISNGSELHSGEEYFLNEGSSARSVKVEGRERDKDHERSGKDEKDLDWDKDNEKFDKGVSYGSKDSALDKLCLFNNKEKHNINKPITVVLQNIMQKKNKPITELDLPNHESCTPSYRLLPKNYKMRPANCITEIGVSVLNHTCELVASGSDDHSFEHIPENQNEEGLFRCEDDVCVSPTSGNEDNSPKHPPENPYEESLFICEDDRFELDMLLESVKHTNKRVDALVEKIQDNTVKSENAICIEDYLTPLSLRCIERIYGDHGMDVMNVLFKDASLALPVISERLKQKQDDWLRCHAYFNKKWDEANAEIHQKLLVHQSLYFKQQDSKNLSTKALLAEIKKISKKKRKEGDVFLAFDSGNGLPISPDMEFEFIDPSIHDDLSRIIKFSCKACASSTDQLDKFDSVWTNFLEPLLGIFTCHDGAEGTEDVVRTEENHAATGSVICLGGKDGSPDADVALNVKNHSTHAHDDEFIPQEQSSPSRSRMMPKESYKEFGFDVVNRIGRRGDKNKHTSAEREEGELAEREEGELSSPNGDFEVEAQGMDDVHDTDGNGSIPSSKRFLRTVKPLAFNEKEDIPTRIFYGNDSFYVLFRLYQILYDRVLSAKKNSAIAEAKWRAQKKDMLPPDLYKKFMLALFNLLDGSADNTKFEDDCRDAFGKKSYVLSTLDKLLYKIVEQLYAITTDEIDSKIFHAFAKSRSSGRFMDEVYREKARALLHDECMYRFECSFNPTRISIQIMGKDEKEKHEVTAVLAEPFSFY